MVDWDRVEQLRKSGWDWDEIADDPKVGYTAVKGSGDPGRSLHFLYRRRRNRTASEEEVAPKSPKRLTDESERKWTLARIGFLVTPLVGIWALVAYLVPSPVGLILPTIPYILLILAVAAFLLIYGLLRSEKRWTKVFRTTLIGGIVLGLVFTGVVALTGTLLFGCPILPSSSSLGSTSAPNWQHVPTSAWQDSGKPVFYFYGASWCPFCSASSWALWKALTQFGTLSGNYLGFSSTSDISPGTPEMVLGNAVLSSNNVSWVVSEDLSGIDRTFPGTSDCFEQAYVSAYSGGAIPFVVLNGQYVHAGVTIVDPTLLHNWSSPVAGNGGAGQVETQVQSESGPAWNAVAPQTYWIMAFLTKAIGAPVAYLAAQYHWTSGTASSVKSDLAQIS